MKRKKQSPRKKLIKYLDGLWSKLTKIINGDKCAWCYSSSPAQSDHIQNRGKYPTRWRVENMVPLCVGCHLFRKPHDPAGWASMVIKRIGQDRWDALEKESNKQGKVDLEKVKDYLETIQGFLEEGGKWLPKPMD